MQVYRIKNRESEDREKIDLETWFDYYQKNTGIFWAILRQRIRVTRYSLEYGSELDDLMQNSLEKVIEKFNKEKTIPELYKHSIFRQAARNAINIHIRQTNLFKGIPAMGIPQEQVKTGESKKDYFAGDGERVMTTSMDYLSIDLKIDIKNCLSKEENKIVVLLLQKYTRKEIAKIIKVDERTVYRKIANIRQKLESAGLREYAC